MPRDISILLIQEPPLQVLPSLAIEIGLNEAIVLQQLHYLLRNPNFGRKVAEHKWIFNTLGEWKMSYFPFWIEHTIQRTFTSLKNKGMIETCQPEGRISRRTYYRINMENLPVLVHEDAKLAPSIMPDRPLPITKTTSETTLTKETKATSSDDDVGSFSATWKPSSKTKEQQLRKIRPPKEYPSQDEFENYIGANCLDKITDYRPDLYSDLCDQKWHKWREDLNKWEPVVNWQNYICALEVHLEGMF